MCSRNKKDYVFNDITKKYVCNLCKQEITKKQFKSIGWSFFGFGVSM